MKRTRDVKPKEGAVARALEDALAPLKWPPTAALTVPQGQQHPVELAAKRALDKGLLRCVLRPRPSSGPGGGGGQGGGNGCQDRFAPSSTNTAFSRPST